jgi:hypothetical protein
MSPELVDKLMNRYPKLFKRAEDNRYDIAHGIFCDDGWYELIDQVCKVVQSRIDWTYTPIQQIEFACIKEKFGKLRFVVHEDIPAYVQGVFALAEEQSACICELTGKTGASMYILDDLRVKTLCAEEAAKGEWKPLTNSPLNNTLDVATLFQKA